MQLLVTQHHHLTPTLEIVQPMLVVVGVIAAAKTDQQTAVLPTYHKNFAATVAQPVQRQLRVKLQTTFVIIRPLTWKHVYKIICIRTVAVISVTLLTR
jgi:hypothetical protein